MRSISWIDPGRFSRRGGKYCKVKGKLKVKTALQICFVSLLHLHFCYVSWMPTLNRILTWFILQSFGKWIRVWTVFTVSLYNTTFYSKRLMPLYSGIIFAVIWMVEIFFLNIEYTYIFIQFVNIWILNNNWLFFVLWETFFVISNDVHVWNSKSKSHYFYRTPFQTFDADLHVFWYKWNTVLTTVRLSHSYWYKAEGSTFLGSLWIGMTCTYIIHTLFDQSSCVCCSTVFEDG